MNKLLLTTVAIATFLITLPLSATTNLSKIPTKIKIPVGKIEKVKIVAELKNEDLKDEVSGDYLNLARLHEEYSIAWLSAWITKEPQLVLVTNEDSLTYYTLTEEELNEIITANNLDKDDLLSLGFFTRFGGKFILFIVLCIILYGAYNTYFGKNKKA